MAEKINWGVIGSGGIARRRTIPEGLVTADNARLAVVYDINEKANAEVAEQFNAKPVGSVDELLEAEIDAVYVAYAQFVSTMVQKPVVLPILPVEPAAIPSAQNVDYIYEPSPQVVLAGLLSRFVEMQIYHAILEAIASEQSARMVAMRNATENGRELIDDLTLMYNKARQESITKELLDITGGVAALT